MSYFPVVQTTSSGSNASGTSHPVTLPSGIVALDRILVMFSSNGTTDTNTPTGWTKLGSTAYSGGSVRLTVYSKIATGGDTLTVTTTGASTSEYACYRVVTKGNIEIGTFTEGNSNSPNSLSLTPVGGSQKYLWFSAIAHNTGGVVSAFPANYTLGQITVNFTSTRIGSAYRALLATSEDPGNYTLTAALNWVAVTVSIQEQTDIIGSSSLLTSSSDIFTLDSNFPGDATFNLLTMSSEFFGTVNSVDNRTRWSNESKPTTNWTNEI